MSQLLVLMSDRIASEPEAGTACLLYCVHDACRRAASCSHAAQSVRREGAVPGRKADARSTRISAPRRVSSCDVRGRPSPAAAARL